MAEQQLTLDGEVAGESEVKKAKKTVSGFDYYDAISALQKYIRRGMVEKAMFWAYELARTNPYHLWRRLQVIVVEDVGNAEAIIAIDTLHRMAKVLGMESRDGIRCAVCAAKILAESKKDRRADEFIELMEKIELNKDQSELKAKYDELSYMDDFVFDGHTVTGKKMGRSFDTEEGMRFWYEVSSETVNKTEEYEKWRREFKRLMLGRRL